MSAPSYRTPKVIERKLTALGWKVQSKYSIMWKHPKLNIVTDYKDAYRIVLLEQRQAEGEKYAEVRLSRLRFDALEAELDFLRKLNAAFIHANKKILSAGSCADCFILNSDVHNHGPDCPVGDVHGLMRASISTYDDIKHKELLSIIDAVNAETEDIPDPE